MKSFLPHRDYFAGRIKDSCVDCHTDAGHKNLGNYLPKKKAPVPSKASNKERT
jgi:cytochrome c-type protein NapC